MSCPSCEEAYGQDRRPRVLQCGHSFCGPCLLRLHRSNGGLISCSQCGNEDYYTDVTKLAVNLDLEARLTSLLLEEEEEDQEEDQEEAVAVRGSPAEKGESPWDICSLHGDPLSSWCTACHCAVCSKCGEFHGSLNHQVVDYREAKELLLSRYKNESQAFLEWLIKVEMATRDTQEAAEATAARLRQTLSVVRRHIKRMRGQEQTLEGTASLETLEDLLEKRSRWSRRSQAEAQQQVDAVIVGFGRLESSMAELRRLQRELKYAFDRKEVVATTAPLPQSEEDRDESREQDAAAPATRVIVAQCGPLVLAPNQWKTLDLGGPKGHRLFLGSTPYSCKTTHLEFRVDDDGWFGVWYLDDAGRQVFRTGWDFWSDRVWMVTWDPTTGNVASRLAGPPREGGRRGGRRLGFLLRTGAVHQARIEEDAAWYKVFLDGVMVGRVEKACGPRPPADAKIQMWCSRHLEISKFLVEAS